MSHFHKFLIEIKAEKHTHVDDWCWGSRRAQMDGEERLAKARTALNELGFTITSVSFDFKDASPR